jgi:hypothetical protein
MAPPPGALSKPVPSRWDHEFESVFLQQRVSKLPVPLETNGRLAACKALRRLVDPQPLSPQTQALKAILERLEPQKPQSIPDTASTG